MPVNVSVDCDMIPSCCLQVVLRARGLMCQSLSCRELIHWALEGLPWLLAGAEGPGLQVSMRVWAVGHQ